MGIVPFPPGGGNLTGNIACTVFFGVTTFLITNFTGTKEYWKEIFWPEVPTWLKVPVPLMPFIELFGIFTKPLALIIRLFANMMAGHAIALSFAAIIFIMFNISENSYRQLSGRYGYDNSKCCDECLYDAPRSIGKLHSGIGIHHAECSIHLAGSCKVS